MDTSSLCQQKFSPKSPAVHSSTVVSSPVHSKFSSHISPSPAPYSDPKYSAVPLQNGNITKMRQHPVCSHLFSNKSLLYLPLCVPLYPVTACVSSQFRSTITSLLIFSSEPASLCSSIWPKIHQYCNRTYVL